MKKILFFMLLVVCGALASSCEGKTGPARLNCEYNESYEGSDYIQRVFSKE